MERQMQPQADEAMTLLGHRTRGEAEAAAFSFILTHLRLTSTRCQPVFCHRLDAVPCMLPKARPSHPNARAEVAPKSREAEGRGGEGG